MSDICPTVKIKRGAGSCIINESDFNGTRHERFVEPPSAPVLPPLPPVPPLPVDPLANLPTYWRESDAAALRAAPSRTRRRPWR
jgi:hypothetical protein